MDQPLSCVHRPREGVRSVEIAMLNTGGHVPVCIRWQCNALWVTVSVPSSSLLLMFCFCFFFCFVYIHKLKFRIFFFGWVQFIHKDCEENVQQLSAMFRLECTSKTLKKCPFSFLYFSFISFHLFVILFCSTFCILTKINGVFECNEHLSECVLWLFIFLWYIYKTKSWISLPIRIWFTDLYTTVLADFCRGEAIWMPFVMQDKSTHMVFTQNRQITVE